MFERFIQPDRTYITLSVLIDKDTPQARKAGLAILNEKAGHHVGKDYTLSEACEAFLTDKKHTARESSVKTIKSSLKTICGVLGGYIAVNDLTAGYIRKKVLEQDKPDRWKNTVITNIKTLLNWCYRNDYIDSPKAADKLTGVSDKKPKKDDAKYMNRDELQAVLDAIPNASHWRLVVEFLALTGLRFGEFSALTPEDFTPEGISINKTFSFTARTTGEPKTPTGNRVISVQDELKECISRMNAFMAAARLSDPDLRDSPLWFPNPKKQKRKDNHIGLYAFDYFLKKTTAKVIGRGLTAHSLRHTHASLLFEAGISLDAVARRLGHAEADKITRQIYVHVTEKLKQKDAEALSKIRLIQ